MTTSILSSIIKPDKESKKTLESIDTTLQKIYKLEFDKDKRDQKDKKEQRQAEKRKEKEKNVLEDILKELRKEKTEKKETLIDKLKKGFMSMIGSIFGKEGPLAKAITGVVSGLSDFAKLLKPGGVLLSGLGKFAKLFAAGGPLLKALGTIGAPVAAVAGAAAAPVIIAGAAGKIAEEVRRNQLGGGEAGNAGLKLDEERRKITTKYFDKRGRQIKEYSPEDKARIDEIDKLTKELIEAKKEKEKAIKSLTTTIGSGRSAERKIDDADKERIEKEYNQKVQNILNQNKKQKGGHINVPGTGSGDRIPMMLPPGSFVMNRNASTMLQNGGLVPTLLEPGEKVFGPGQYGPMHELMNTMIPRFQKGGTVGQQESGSARGNTVPAPTPKSLEPAVQAAKSTQNSTGTSAILKAAENSIGLMKGEGEQCSNSTRSVLEAAGHPAAGKTTKKGDLDPEGLKYSAPSFAASFAGSDMGTVKRSISALTPGDIMLWKDTYGNYVPGAITHVGIAGPGNSQFDHNKSRGWHKRDRSALANKFAYGITLNGTAAGGGDNLNSDVASGTSQPVSFLQSLLGQVSGMGQVGEALGSFLGQVNSALGENSWLLSAIFGGGMGMAPAMAASENSGGGGTGGATPSYNGPNQVSKEVMKDALLKAGFDSSKIPTMIAVGMAESSGNSKAHNTNRATGDNSYGLWQINMIDKLGPERRKEFGISSNDALFDPYVNAKAAKKIYDSQGINAWGAYTNGSYKQYLQQGGIVNMSPSTSGNTSRFKQAQEEFAQMIAEKSGSPIVIMNNNGGGGGGTSVIPAPSVQQTPPNLPDGPSTVQAAEYFYRLNMGSVF